MEMIDIKDIKSKEEARQLAIDWQIWQTEESLYMSEVAEWADYFTEVGHRFGLTREYKQNGII
jgi:hypothetical protein